MRLKAKASVGDKHCAVASSVGVWRNKSHTTQLTRRTVMAGARLLAAGVRLSQDNLKETNSTQLDLIYILTASSLTYFHGNSSRKSQF